MSDSHIPPSIAQPPCPARRVGWGAVALGVPVATAIVLAAGMKPVIASFLPLGTPSLLLLVVHRIYARWRPHPLISDMSGMMAMMILACLFAAIISHAGLRLDFPYVDASLAAADRAMGFDTPQLALALALHPFWGNWLAMAYVSSFPAAFLVALALAACNQTKRAWELAATFSACILAAAALSIFWPAIGSMVHHGIDRAKGLPQGTGNYHLAAVGYYRFSDQPLLDMARFSGIVTMPSFHMIMALWAVVAWLTQGCIFPVGTLKGPRDTVPSLAPGKSTL